MSKVLGRIIHEKIHKQEKFDVVSKERWSQDLHDLTSGEGDNGSIAMFYFFQKLLVYRFNKITRLEM